MAEVWRATGLALSEASTEAGGGRVVPYASCHTLTEVTRASRSIPASGTHKAAMHKKNERMLFISSNAYTDGRYKDTDREGNIFLIRCCDSDLRWRKQVVCSQYWGLNEHPWLGNSSRGGCGLVQTCGCGVDILCAYLSRTPASQGHWHGIEVRGRQSWPTFFKSQNSSQAWRDKQSFPAKPTQIHREF